MDHNGRFPRDTRRGVTAVGEGAGSAHLRGAASRHAARSRFVGVILNDPAGPFLRTLLPPLEDALAEAGRAVMLCNSNESFDRQADYIRDMTEFEADGIVVCPAIGSQPEHFSLKQAWMPPLVFMSRGLLDTAFDCVLDDDREAARLATERLLTLGHRRIAVVGGDPSVLRFAERLRGHRAALGGASVTFDDALVRPCLPTIGEGFRSARWIAKLSPRPTAAIGYNGSVALGLFHGLVRGGLFPGTNFALIGHGDIEEASLVDPPISVTRGSPAEMGRRAAATLLERMSNPEASPKRIVLKTELVVRGTCGVEVAAAQ